MKLSLQLPAAAFATVLLFLLTPTPASAQVSGSCFGTDGDDDGVGGSEGGGDEFLVSGLLTSFNACTDEDTELYEDPFPSEVTTNIFQFDFGTGTPIVALKISVGGVTSDFFVTVTAQQISQEEAAALTGGNFVCIETAENEDPELNNCVMYDVSEPAGNPFEGPVIVTAFWNSPPILPGDDVRLLKRGDLDEAFTDITTEVLVVTDEVANLSEDDPGVRGQTGNPPSFSLFLPVIATDESTNAARLWLGLFDPFNRQLRYDIRAELYRNGVRVSSGTINSVDSRHILALLQTIPLSSPTQAFVPGNSVTLKVSARNACVGSSGKLGKGILWFNAKPVDSRLTFEGVGTLYLRRILLHSKLLPNLGVLPRLDFVLVGKPCGSFKSFGTWTGTVQ